MRFGFVGGTYQHAQSTINAEQCVNWMPERTDRGQAKAALVYVVRPGLTTFTTAGTGRWRASFEQNGRAFVVTGNTLYEVDEHGTATSRGTVADDGKPASICGNGPAGNQLFITGGGLAYTFTLSTNTFAQVTDGDLPANIIMGFYFQGYFGVLVEDSMAFYVSDLLNGSSWNALSVGEKSKTTDTLVAAIVDQDQGELWLIGRRTTEVWWHSGTAGTVPFEPVPTIVPVGSCATFGWCALGGAIYGLTTSVHGEIQVVRFRGGYTPEPVSHPAMDATIQGYSDAQLDTAHLFSLVWGGHRFVIAQFVQADATWVFDETTSLWTQWDHWNSAEITSEAYLGVGQMFAFGKQLVGSHQGGTIYEYTADALDDAGDTIRTVRRAPCIHAEGKRVPHRAIHFEFQMGVGLASGQGSDPVGLVRWSDTQAKSWSNEHTVTLGAMGEYGQRATLNRLGLAGFHGRVYELVVTDPVVRALVDAYVDVGRAA